MDSSDGFLPHGVCLSWDPGLVTAMVGAETLLGLSYVSVALTLGIFARKRRDFPYPWLLVLLALVFAACGVSHLTDVLTLFVPLYTLQLGFKTVVAAFSVPAAVLMWVLLPRALELPSPAALRAANRSLTEAKEAAEQASRAKSDFLATMSHELRTPLNAVIGFSEALSLRLFGELNQRQAEYIDSIHGSAQHLLHLINDILDITKIDAGRMELDRETLALDQVVGPSVALVRGQAEAAGVELAVSVALDTPCVSGDRLRLKQVLLNLLSNAIKFTPSGGRVRLAVGPDRAGGVEIAVADTGIGMRPEDVTRAFEMFTQIADPMVRSQGGTGVGLPLTKALVELHGGWIVVESSPGQGTRVNVHLPGAGAT